MTEKRLSEVRFRDPRELKHDPRNTRRHPEAQKEQVKASIRRLSFYQPILLRDDETTIGAGHCRRDCAVEMIEAGETIPGAEEGLRIPTLTLYGLSDEEWRALVIADNRLPEGAEWDFDLLKSELGELDALGFDIGLTGFTLEGLGDLGGSGGSSSGGSAGASNASLAERFGVVPFSVLNAREGWWQDRKAAWLSLGIRSEIGRAGNLLHMSETMLEPDPAKRAAAKAAGEEITASSPSGGGTSIFDPVLCELVYRWWCPPEGLVLDPFAGGSVRGIVAGRLGRRYLGVDLRADQVAENERQAAAILGEGAALVEWREGDSREVVPKIEAKADLIFSCPPYADLERYSDDPRDLSTMEYSRFVVAYRSIIAAAAKRLKSNRFAIFVVGEVRGPDGNYLGLVPDTIRAFESAGLRLYNEAILVTAVGNLAMRAGRTFAASRKLGKTHQNVLVFVKGDAKKAVDALGRGPVEFGEVEAQDFDAESAEAQTEDGVASEPTRYGEKVTGLGGEL